MLAVGKEGGKRKIDVQIEKVRGSNTRKRKRKGGINGEGEKRLVPFYLPLPHLQPRFRPYSSSADMPKKGLKQNLKPRPLKPPHPPPPTSEYSRTVPRD
jgi:hypothetical protein